MSGENLINNCQFAKKTLNRKKIITTWATGSHANVDGTLKVQQTKYITNCGRDQVITSLSLELYTRLK